MTLDYSIQKDCLLNGNFSRERHPKICNVLGNSPRKPHSSLGRVSYRIYAKGFKR